MIPSGMRSEDKDKYELTEIEPGMYIAKNVYKGKYVFGAEPPSGLVQPVAKAKKTKYVVNYGYIIAGGDRGYEEFEDLKIFYSRKEADELVGREMKKPHVHDWWHRIYEADRFELVDERGFK